MSENTNFTIFNTDNSVNIEGNILWQYENSPALKSLIQQKQDWYDINQTKFWQDWAKDVLNIQTANDFGLKIWGLLLGVSRIYDINGVQTTLTTEQYRMLLKSRLFYMTMNCSIPEINKYLKSVFNANGLTNENFIVQDNLDMTMNYVLDFEPTAEQLALFLNCDILPRPQGVKIKLYSINKNKTFGFNGSGMQPFNQGTFWNRTPLN